MAYKRISPQPVVEGGTGAQTFTSHGVLLGNTTSAITATAAGTTGQILTGVTGSAPTFQSPAASSISITGDSGGAQTGNAFTFTGSTTGLTFAGATDTLTLGGTLAIANGGTNATSMATTDGVVYYDGTRLVTTAVGTATQVLTSNGAGMAPTFQNASGGSGITTIDGDTGSVTGSTVSIKSNSTSGSSTSFSGSGTAMVFNVTDANQNVIIGSGSGNSSISGINNVGLGLEVLSSISSGNRNTCIGTVAGNALATGYQNVIIGNGAGSSLYSGQYNVILGTSAGTNYNDAETYNIVIGTNVAGATGENSTIRIGNQGTQTTCHIAGIFGETVSAGSGTAVLIDNTGLLGTVLSSARFKTDINDLGDFSSKILELRPVSFAMKKTPTIQQQGLIAEEVEKVIPELVVKDKEGFPLSVKYEGLPVLLLNELQKALKRIEALEAKIK